MIEMDERDVTRFINWIASVEQAGLERLTRENFCAKLSDGIAFLRLMEAIEPGVVDWSRVNLHTENKFKLLANCNLVVSLMQAFNFSEGLVRGRDLVEGKLKSMLSLMWLLMREFYLRKHNIQSEEEFQAIANQYLEVVLNHTQSLVLAAAPDSEDVESLRIVLYYGEEGEIFMTFHDESELMCPLLPENFEELLRQNLRASPGPLSDRPAPARTLCKAKPKHRAGADSPDEPSPRVGACQPGPNRAPENSEKVKQTTRDGFPISLVADISPLFFDMCANSSELSRPALADLRPTHPSKTQETKRAQKARACPEDPPAQPEESRPPEPRLLSEKSSKQESLRPRSAVIATNYNSRDTNGASRSRRIHIPIVISYCPEDLLDPALTENFDMYSNRKRIMLEGSSEKLALPGGLQLQYKSAASRQRDKHSEAAKAYRSEQLAEEKENCPTNGNFQTPATTRFEVRGGSSKQKEEVTYRSRHNIPRSALKVDQQPSERLCAPDTLAPTLTSFVVVPQLREADPGRFVDGFKKENLANRKNDAAKPLFPAACQLGIPLTTEAHLKLAKLSKGFLENLGIGQASSPHRPNRSESVAGARARQTPLEKIDRASRMHSIILQLPDCQTKKSLQEILHKLQDFDKIPADFMRQAFGALNTSHLSEAHKALVQAFQQAFFSPERALPAPPAFLTAKMQDPFAPRKPPDECGGLPAKWSQLDDKEKKRLYRERVKERILTSSELVEQPADPTATLASVVCQLLAPKRTPKLL